MKKKSLTERYGFFTASPEKTHNFGNKSKRRTPRRSKILDNDNRDVIRKTQELDKELSFFRTENEKIKGSRMKLRLAEEKFRNTKTSFITELENEKQEFEKWKDTTRKTLREREIVVERRLKENKKWREKCKVLRGVISQKDKEMEDLKAKLNYCERKLEKQVMVSSKLRHKVKFYQGKEFNHLFRSNHV